MKIRCEVHCHEVDGVECAQEGFDLVVKNYPKMQASVYRRGLIIIGVGNHEYLVEARDLSDAVHNAGLNTGVLE